jgi:hypothetical protein
MEKRKNCWVIPTDKPSRLGYLTKKGKEVFKDLRLFDKPMRNILDSENQHIYITSDEEIKEGDYAINSNGYLIKINQFSEDELSFIPLKKDVYCNTETWHKIKLYKKIILTTDQDLIADGVQSIDDEFLEWFFINPSCEEVKIEGHVYKGQNLTHYKIIIPKEEPKFTTGHQFLEKADKVIVIHRPKQETLEEASKILYSEVDMIQYALYIHETKNNLLSPSEWYEKFKKK